MESNNSPKAILKKLTQDLASYKIELHQTRAFLQGILQNSNDMIFATDVDGIIVSFSRGGEKVLGYSWDDVSGTSIKDLSQDPDSFQDLLNVSKQKGSAVRLEFPFQHKKGNPVYCDVSLISLTNTQGQRVGVVGVCRDITQWKKLQKELIRIDRLAEIGRIAAGIAHEINNPLEIINEISGWLEEEALRDDIDPSTENRNEFNKAIKKIKEQTERCKNITHQLLGFVRDSDPDKSEFDVHETVRETIKFLGPELKNSSINIKFNFFEECIRMKSDYKMIQQILVNLLSNAIHAIKEKGNKNGLIEIRTDRIKKEVEIDIQDNGIGISDEDQDKIFDLFFTTKPPGKGTGLGLSISQNIIHSIGGTLSFKSVYGSGSTFILRIPIS